MLATVAGSLFWLALCAYLAGSKGRPPLSRVSLGKLAGRPAGFANCISRRRLGAIAARLGQMAVGEPPAAAAAAAARRRRALGRLTPKRKRPSQRWQANFNSTRNLSSSWRRFLGARRRFVWPALDAPEASGPALHWSGLVWSGLRSRAEEAAGSSLANYVRKLSFAGCELAAGRPALRAQGQATTTCCK